MNMALTEVSHATELEFFLEASPVAIVTFSAHWCEPCQKSKPQLEELASSAPIPFAYVPEADMDDFADDYKISAFPTYICFVDGKEVERVEGADLAAVEAMMKKHTPSA